jgi:hypothetical protein
MLKKEELPPEERYTCSMAYLAYIARIDNPKKYKELLVEKQVIGEPLESLELQNELKEIYMKENGVFIPAEEL